MGLVVPAVLPSSRRDFEEKLEFFSRVPSVSRVQIDVVDGRFISPASWPYSTPVDVRDMLEEEYLFPYSHNFEYEIDLMCLDADHIAEMWLAFGATRLVFHAESTTDLPRLLASARRRYGGEFASLISFGVALNIASDLAIIEPVLAEVQFVQFMGIAQIGKQGQPFDTHVFEKVRTFRARHPDIPVQVDGGVSLDTAKSLLALGVSNLVIGSTIARAKNPVAAIAAFENLQTHYGV